MEIIEHKKATKDTNYTPIAAHFSEKFNKKVDRRSV